MEWLEEWLPFLQWNRIEWAAALITLYLCFGFFLVFLFFIGDWEIIFEPPITKRTVFVTIGIILTLLFLWPLLFIWVTIRPPEGPVFTFEIKLN